MTGYNNILY